MLDFKLDSSKAQPETTGAATVYDLMIIGGGSAGLTSAIYAGRAALKTIVLAGPLPGGQIATTDQVENYPGFPEGISGAELAQRIQAQAEKFAGPVISEPVIEVDFKNRPFVAKTGSNTYRAHTIIITTGAQPRRLGVPGEQTFFGRGVSTCATCDGFFYKGKRVVVVGGGDSAIDEGLFLTKFASEVIVIHRRDQLRAAPMYQERAFANPKMNFVWDSVVKEVLGEQTVTGVRVQNVKTDEESVIPTDGVFVYIGMIPVTKLFKGQIDLDEWGYIITDCSQSTNIPGVFAAGDVQNSDFRQIVIAAGSGAVAAIAAEKFLATQAALHTSNPEVSV